MRILRDHIEVTRISLAGAGRVLVRAVSILVLALLITALPFAIQGDARSGNSRGPTAGSTGGQSYPGCRFGLTVRADQHEHVSIVPKLNVGWHLNFGSSLPAPGPQEAEYVPMVHVSQGGEPDRECGLEGVFDVYPALDQTLASVVAANPGLLWIVGNEPDRYKQDDICPQQYAQAYHDVYHFIKERDPTAQIAVAGLVQVTPMRMDYLDIVWDSYLITYGEPMPVDVWTMHIYILAETGHGDAHLAIGADESLAIGFNKDCDDPSTYCHAEHDDVSIFVDHVIRMRQWMKDHGQQDKPLILTEFGILKPFHYPWPDPENPNSDGICSVITCPSPSTELDCFCDESKRTFHPLRVSVYLTSTVEYLRTAVDPDLGFPADENRLVQQWLWYLLATQYVDGLGHPSNLADPASMGPDGEWELTVVGQTWQDYVRAITPTVNLRATAVPTSTGYLLPGGDASVRLLASAVNNGDVVVTDTVTVTFYADAELTAPLGSTTLPQVPGCARREVSVSLRTTWPGVGAGVHDYWFELDSPAELPESDETDNVGIGSVHVFAHAFYMPLCLRDG